MAGFGEALNGAVRESVSRILDVADTALSYGRALSWVADRYQEAANWLRRKIGDVPPGEDIPPIDPPFAGGQCPVLYTVTVTVHERFRNFPSDPWTERFLTGTRNAVGAIVGVERVFNAGQGAYRVALVSEGGDVVAETSPPLGWSSNSDTFEVLSVGITSIVRVDGQPDDCGSPPITDLPDPIPPGGYTGDITVIWDDRDNVTHTEEGDITIYAPVISIDGSINIPINVNVGGIELDGSIDITNNLEVTLNPKGADRIAPRPTIDLPMPPDIPDAGDPVNLVLARNAISGVVVRSTVGSDAKATQVGQDSAPTLFLPRLANLYFVYRVGDSFAWSEPFPIVHINQLVPVPFDFSAYAYYIWEEFDVNCTVYPVSGNLVPLVPEP